jgi:hypothetical protein
MSDDQIEASRLCSHGFVGSCSTDLICCGAWACCMQGCRRVRVWYHAVGALHWWPCIQGWVAERSMQYVEQLSPHLSPLGWSVLALHHAPSLSACTPCCLRCNRLCILLGAVCRCAASSDWASDHPGEPAPQVATCSTCGAAPAVRALLAYKPGMQV